MIWSLKVGDPVICVDADEVNRYAPHRPVRPEDMTLDGLRLGEKYTIREIGCVGGIHVLKINEIVRSFECRPGDFGWYAAARFRPLVSEGMKTLQGLLAPSPAKSRERV